MQQRFSYQLKTPAGDTVLLMNARGDFSEGERVRVHHGNRTLQGTISKKFTERHRPARQRRGR